LFYADGLDVPANDDLLTDTEMQGSEGAEDEQEEILNSGEEIEKEMDLLSMKKGDRVRREPRGQVDKTRIGNLLKTRNFFDLNNTKLAASLCKDFGSKQHNQGQVLVLLNALLGCKTMADLL
jgi:hypothetical protein